jgi:hypothetical protein
VGIEQMEDLGMFNRGFVTPIGTALSLRRMAAAATIEYVKHCECNMAQCWILSKCSTSHPAVCACTTKVFHAAQDLKKVVPRCSWPSGAEDTLRRYIPLMKVVFGEQDADVRDVQNMLGGGDGGGEPKVPSPPVDKGNGRTNRKKKKNNRGNKKK